MTNLLRANQRDHSVIIILPQDHKLSSHVA
ncbi:hypothetical protein F383_30073 [Gossypium arboreum]|uniref:Uncharacterized protein n=1 Tax=Gossypium arboreum TaxID=29729 RepID=A0A0B0PE12_GOSAR|nr:hypothetical protein F383_30073 [Gossypium arboreum]